MNVDAFIKLVHKGQVRKTGEDYTEHLYAVFNILKNIGITDEAILKAALLHDVLEETCISRKYLDFCFGRRVSDIVFYLSKTRKGYWNTPYCRMQSYRSLMDEFMTRYPEVVLIKMADRAHNLRTAHVFRLDKINRYIEETETIFIPLFLKSKELVKSTEFQGFVCKLMQYVNKNLKDLKKYRDKMSLASAV